MPVFRGVLSVSQENTWLFHSIPGMQWGLEIDHLRKLFCKSDVHIEVGCYCGKSVFATASGMQKGSKIFAIDNFSYPDPQWGRSVLAATFRECLSRFGVEVALVEMPSVDAAREFEKSGILADSVFIDASHEYEDCKADIQMWSRHCKPDGLICGHDYWPIDAGVIRAVQEAFGSKFEVVEGTRIWTARPGDASWQH